MATIRENAKIKTDIETAGKIGRQDIYEILHNATGATLAEKTSGVETFLDALPAEIKNKVSKSGKTVKENILADLGSYPL